MAFERLPQNERAEAIGKDVENYINSLPVADLQKVVDGKLPSVGEIPTPDPKNGITFEDISNLYKVLANERMINETPTAQPEQGNA